MTPRENLELHFAYDLNLSTPVPTKTTADNSQKISVTLQNINFHNKHRCLARTAYHPRRTLSFRPPTNGTSPAKGTTLSATIQAQIDSLKTSDFVTQTRRLLKLEICRSVAHPFL